MKHSISTPERYYRIRFYLFLTCGALVSIVYILTMGYGFMYAEREMRNQIAIANQWHKKEYEKAWNYRYTMMDHIKRHDEAIIQEEREMKDTRVILQRLDRFLKGWGF